MNALATQGLITDGLADFGASALIVLTAVIAIVVGFLVFRWGWRKIKGSAQ